MLAGSIINIFTSLGNHCKDMSDNTIGNDSSIYSNFQSGSWHSEDNIRYALQSWHKILSEENIKKWLENYEIRPNHAKRQIGIIMAGNLPLVGLHDLLCTLAAGHSAVLKPAYQDRMLMLHLIEFLVANFPALEPRIKITDKIDVNDIDAIIATGSNNTARSIAYHFKSIPSIIRHNRNSLAIIDGNESENDFVGLSDDVFLHFGMGCRNVSMIFMPCNFDKNALFNALNKYSYIINNEKYKSSYLSQKAKHFLLKKDFVDHTFYLTRNQISLDAPPAVLNFAYYKNVQEALQFIHDNAQHIQCVVSNAKYESIETVPFGSTQCPVLQDYADGIDTMRFLLSLR